MILTSRRSYVDELPILILTSKDSYECTYRQSLGEIYIHCCSKPKMGKGLLTLCFIFGINTEQDPHNYVGISMYD
jgi:hypothetical protein